MHYLTLDSNKYWQVTPHNHYLWCTSDYAARWPAAKTAASWNVLHSSSQLLLEMWGSSANQLWVKKISAFFWLLLVLIGFLANWSFYSKPPEQTSKYVVKIKINVKLFATITIQQNNPNRVWQWQAFNWGNDKKPLRKKMISTIRSNLTYRNICIHTSHSPKKGLSYNTPFSTLQLFRHGKYAGFILKYTFKLPQQPCA